ncbi:MAG: hypothetical protein KBD78_09620 [Oligoflexales bacterium]|nr:hypothetical protein [Oligoflexales bacterium]
MNFKHYIGAGILGMSLLACGNDNDKTPVPAAQTQWNEGEKQEAIDYYAESAVLLTNGSHKKEYGLCIFNSMKDKVSYQTWVTTKDDSDIVSATDKAACTGSLTN